jgi:hypothetical protein
MSLNADDRVLYCVLEGQNSVFQLIRTDIGASVFDLKPLVLADKPDALRDVDADDLRCLK